MMWCEKILTSGDGMKDKGGWRAINVVFHVDGFNLKILNSVESTKGSNYPNSCFFKFVDGQLFDQSPSIPKHVP